MIPSILKQARWIWPENLHWDLHNGYALFRKTFSLSAVPARALLFITADQSYQLHVNGHYVCRGPARGFQKTWPLDRIDVRPWLKKGENLIAIRAHNPGFSNFQYVHQGYAGLLLAAQWGKIRLVSDASWKCRRQSGVRKDTVPTSLQLFSQESIDLRLEDPEWMMPGHDDRSWTDTCQSVVWNSMPWYALEERGIPLLEEKEIRIGQILGRNEGKSRSDFLIHPNLSHLRLAEGLGHHSAGGSADQFEFPKSGRGRWQSVLIDLGKLHVGSVILEIPQAQGGEIFETHHYETIDPKSLTPNYDPKAHCRLAFSNRLTCRPGANRHSFYHTFGFRYMIVTVRGNAAPISIRTSLRTTVYPLKEKGALLSSDPLLNAIWKTCAWTQRVCSLDAYVDTPHREQAQWWGDARVQAWNTFHLDGDTRLFRRGIRQIAAQTTPDGLTYGHSPTIAHNCILPDFTLIWMLTIWDYYWQTGSLEPFQTHREVIARALGYFKQWTSPETGLLNHDPRFWLFLDWVGLRREGCSSVYSLWLLNVLDRFAEMYRLAGDKKESADCSKWAVSLRRSLHKLIDADGLLRDGYTPEGKMDPSTSIHAQTLAIMNGLSPRHEKAMLKLRLIPFLKGELKDGVPPSAYWITYVYSLLESRGFGPEVVADIRKRWAPMCEHGSTWEHFQPAKGSESFSHAWSAHPLFHLMQILGGLRQSAPGWGEIAYQPSFVGNSARVVLPTPLGLVRSSWARKQDGIQGKLVLPSGMRAEIHLPGHPIQFVTGPGSHHFAIKAASLPGNGLVTGTALMEG